MELIADGLLFAGAFGAALYCWVLSRRVHALKNLESGLGGAIAALSHRVNETRSSLAEAKAAAGDTSRDLKAVTARAEIAAGRLELLLASLHEGNTQTSVKGEQVGDARRRAEGAKSAKVQQVPIKGENEEEREILSALKNIVEGWRK